MSAKLGSDWPGEGVDAEFGFGPVLFLGLPWTKGRLSAHRLTTAASAAKGDSGAQRNEGADSGVQGWLAAETWVPLNLI